MNAFARHTLSFPKDLVIVLPIVLLVGAAAGPASAAEVQVSVAATAIDPPNGFVANTAGGTAGPVQGTQPVVSFGTSATSGIVSSSAGMQADAYTGQIRGNVLSTVGSLAPAGASGGSATSIASMNGSITLGSAGLPGMATFSAVVEGSYDFGSSASRFMNSAFIEANGVIGDVYRGFDRFNFDPFTGAGFFSFPLTWAVPVQPGQRLDMSFYVRMGVISAVGATDIDMLNSFKLTSLNLPGGYTYTPDAQGFLSQFTPSVVPEPASGLLLIAGLLTLLRKRLHR